MIPDFGYGLVLISFGLAIYSIIASVFGYYKRSFKLVDSARLAMQLMFPLITIASVLLMYLLATDSYYVSFVYEVTSRSMPMYLKITALWGGQSGSLLFWAWTLTAFSSAVTLREWDRDRDLLPWVVVVNSVTAAFFIGMIVFYENPFAKFWQTIDGSVITAMFQPAGAVLFTAPDGQGLNPLLRHPGMIIHPPMLYLGFVSYVIPFSFALAALITGRTDDRWTRITRRWSIVAWLFLSIGLILGGRWAYDVLGWGGYWGWDPVEIAAFMPWLVGTAFLHSVMIQEQRGMFKEWNMILIILTYVLVIFGTFLTRSGVLSSVHAFAQSAIGPAFFIFIGITIVISVSLLIYRWSDLKAESELTSLLSRESLFLLNNLLFISILIVCFWGVLFPLISELVTGQKVTVGPPFYERATGPLFAGLLFLMGIAPLSAWGKTTLKTLGRSSWKSAVISVVVVLGFVVFLKMYNPYAIIGFAVVIFSALITLHEFWRAASARSRAQKENIFLAFWQIFGKNRRRYGGYLIHLSVIMMAIGIIGLEMFQTETQGTLRQGESITIRDYKVTYTDLAIFDTNDNRNLARAVVSIEKNGEYVGELYPRRDYFYESQQPMTIPGVRSTIEDDLYVLLVDWQPITVEGATFKIYHNPLVNWLWWGTYLMIIGSLVAMWPQKEKSSVREKRQISKSTLLDQSEA
ncbi:MAG TPA: heme lyase CcmF/NrfE family subunit [Anaerolineales bacterium]|nr:heme lyase CcmF/NrfE family subunit [Anaerolineales bacterium]